MVDEIREHSCEMLVDCRTPRHVEFRDSLPKSVTGKVLWRELVVQEGDNAEPERSESGSVEDTG